MAATLHRLGAQAPAARCLRDRFRLRQGGDAAALAARDIRLALVRDPVAREALDAAPGGSLYRLPPARLAAGDRD